MLNFDTPYFFSYTVESETIGFTRRFNMKPTLSSSLICEINGKAYKDFTIISDQDQSGKIGFNIPTSLSAGDVLEIYADEKPLSLFEFKFGTGDILKSPASDVVFKYLASLKRLYRKFLDSYQQFSMGFVNTDKFFRAFFSFLNLSSNDGILRVYGYAVLETNKPFDFDLDALRSMVKRSLQAGNYAYNPSDFLKKIPKDLKYPVLFYVIVKGDLPPYYTVYRADDKIDFNSKNISQVAYNHVFAERGWNCYVGRLDLIKGLFYDGYFSKNVLTVWEDAFGREDMFDFKSTKAVVRGKNVLQTVYIFENTSGMPNTYNFPSVLFSNLGYGPLTVDGKLPQDIDYQVPFTELLEPKKYFQVTLSDQSLKHFKMNSLDVLELPQETESIKQYFSIQRGFFSVLGLDVDSSFEDLKENMPWLLDLSLGTESFNALKVPFNFIVAYLSQNGSYEVGRATKTNQYNEAGKFKVDLDVFIAKELINITLTVDLKSGHFLVVNNTNTRVVTVDRFFIQEGGRTYQIVNDNLHPMLKKDSVFVGAEVRTSYTTQDMLNTFGIICEANKVKIRMLANTAKTVSGDYLVRNNFDGRALVTQANPYIFEASENQSFIPFIASFNFQNKRDDGGVTEVLSDNFYSEVLSKENMLLTSLSVFDNGKMALTFKANAPEKLLNYIRLRIRIMTKEVFLDRHDVILTTIDGKTTVLFDFNILQNEFQNQNPQVVEVAGIYGILE